MDRRGAVGESGEPDHLPSLYKFARCDVDLA